MITSIIIRRAMRWASAALRAGRRPPGPVDAEWIRTEALAWERCAADWSAAGDEDRSYLAARRGARYPDVPAHDPPSAWAKELAGRPLLREEPFLAEMACS